MVPQKEEVPNTNFPMPESMESDYTKQPWKMKIFFWTPKMEGLEHDFFPDFNFSELLGFHCFPCQGVYVYTLENYEDVS